MLGCGGWLPTWFTVGLERLGTLREVGLCLHPGNVSLALASHNLFPLVCCVGHACAILLCHPVLHLKDNPPEDSQMLVLSFMR